MRVISWAWVEPVRVRWYHRLWSLLMWPRHRGRGYKHVTVGCDSCASADDQVCPASEHACGHHCNHSWSHERCCWCREEWGAS